MSIRTRLALVLLAAAPTLLLAKPAPNVETAGPMTGMWKGHFAYPGGENKDPVDFKAAIVQDGERFIGFLQEPNTFGERREPWLHAVIKGTVSEQGRVTSVKTYDGTGGPNHDVQYKGLLEGSKVTGDWNIGDFAGTFVMSRIPGTGGGAAAGLYSGEFLYPEAEQKASVGYTAIVVHDGKRIVGLMKEKKTFGKRDEPWLQASLKGEHDAKAGIFRFTKTYDGTAGVDHDVEYNGTVNRDGSVGGIWNIRDDLRGRFTMQNLRLDKNVMATVQ